MSRTYVHEITLDMPPAEALPLFTPKGEEAWAPGWQPTYIEPADGETREEMTFTTGEGNELTFWTCLKWRLDAGHIRYLRLTPALRLAFVDVRCRSASPDKTNVRVAYEIQPLTDAGRRFVAETTDAAFRDMIDQWAEQIRGTAVPAQFSASPA